MPSPGTLARREVSANDVMSDPHRRMPGAGVSVSLAGAAGGGGPCLRAGLSLPGRLAADALGGDLFQFLLRAPHAINRALAIAEKGLPMDPLRVGNPLLVGLGVTAGGCLFLEDRALGAGKALIDLAQFGRVFGLDAEMRDAGGLAAMCADREIDPRITE